MGLLDTIKSAFGGSDESEETADGDDSDTESPSQDAAESEESESTTASSDESATGDRELDDGTDAPAADAEMEDSPSAEEAAESEAAGSEKAAEADSGRSEEPTDSATLADEEPTDGESLTADDESGFDHLTTEEVRDGPDMAEEAAELITEAEAEGDDDDAADGVESIPEDDPRAEFVEQAEDLVEFWGEYDLDYTLDSLTNLDDLVNEQWDPERFEDVEFGGDDYDSQVFTDTVTQLGSYFGEVLVREHGGNWQQETGVGWTVTVPSGPESEATGATVTVFQVAEDCLSGPSTFTGMHDALADRLNLSGRAGDGDTPVDLDRADIETVATDNEIDDAAERLREGAEDLADRWPSYDLDLTVDSLGRLEDLLDEEVDRERFEGVELGDETDQESMLLTAHVVGVAGYLAEVLRRQRDATWAEDGRMVLVVERGDSRTRIDPIEVAIASVRGNGTLVTAVPDTE